ncbi:hypothetical protein [Pararcticibacter amylolyticus]|nr:hypothetical protein [Pararcticibacter amylolyticus]
MKIFTGKLSIRSDSAPSPKDIQYNTGITKTYKSEHIAKAVMNTIRK